MALPTYKGSGTFTAAIGAITVPMPTGGAAPAANDILLCVCTSENEAISLSTANGFVEIPASPQFAGTAATNPASRLAVFWKRAVGGDAAPVMADSGNHNDGQIHCFAGCKTTDDPWDPATPVGGNDGGGNDTNFSSIPGATTTLVDCLVVVICSSSFNGTSTAEFSAWTNANLTTLTERADNTNTAGLGGGHGLITGGFAGPGAYGVTGVTLANTSFKGAISIALAPVQPVNYTVTAAGGGYTWSSEAVTLGLSLKVTGGAVTALGSAATLWAARSVPVSAGVYALTGMAATLSQSGATLSLAAASGSFSWLGTSTTLKTARTVTADAGSVTWIGNAATFPAARIVAATAGSWALTGTPVDFVLGAPRVLAASAGSYLQFGHTVTLTKMGGSAYLCYTWEGSTATVVPTEYPWSHKLYMYGPPRWSKPFTVRRGIYIRSTPTTYQWCADEVLPVGAPTPITWEMM